MAVRGGGSKLTIKPHVYPSFLCSHRTSVGNSNFDMAPYHVLHMVFHTMSFTWYPKMQPKKCSRDADKQAHAKVWSLFSCKTNCVTCMRSEVKVCTISAIKEVLVIGTYKYGAKKKKPRGSKAQTINGPVGHKKWRLVELGHYSSHKSQRRKNGTIWPPVRHKTNHGPST